MEIGIDMDMDMNMDVVVWMERINNSTGFGFDCAVNVMN